MKLSFNYLLLNVSKVIFDFLLRRASNSHFLAGCCKKKKYCSEISRKIEATFYTTRESSKIDQGKIFSKQY